MTAPAGTSAAGGYQYGYTDPTPGGTTVGEGGLEGTFLPIQSSSETTHQVLNPAYDPENEGQFGSQQGGNAMNPEAPIFGAGDLDNPVADEDARDTEGTPLTDHTEQIPTAPRDVAAVAGLTGHATVTWLAPLPEPTGYPLTHFVVTTHSADDPAPTIPAPVTVGPTVLTADISGLDAGAHYTFTVQAVNDAGTGPASAPTDAVTVIFPPGVATAITLVLDPTSMATTDSSTATATVRDGNGDPVTAETVTITSSDVGAVVGTVTDNDDGTYSAGITSTVAGSYDITATDSALSDVQTLTVTS